MAAVVGIALLVATLLPLGLVAGVIASTPATAGYRDFDYGLNAGTNRRATGDKPQSKLWFTDGYWWAAMFNPAPTTKWKIYRLDTTTQDWVSTGVTIDDRDQSHGDYLWDETSQKLYVASAHNPSTTTPDDVRIFRFSYNASLNTYTADDLDPSSAVNYVTIPDSAAETVTIARDSTGQLWVTYPHIGSGTDTCGKTPSDIMVATTNGSDATDWNAPFQLPAEGSDRATADDISAVIAFKDGADDAIGVMYSAQGCIASGGDHEYFSVHKDSDVDNTWSAKETANSGIEEVDDHINLKFSPATGRLFAITKTGKDQNANQDLDEINLLERDTSGNWTTHLVSQVRENQTRPQILIDDDHQRVYAFSAATETSDGGEIFIKSATFDQLDADSPSTPAFAPGTGQSFIASASDLLINDPTTTKQVVSHATGVVVLGSDRTTHHYLHNSFPIAVVDTTPPVGSLSINAGAAIATDADVNLSVPATDTQSAVVEVDVGNGAAPPGSFTTLAYADHVPWTLSGGDGTKTVSVRWRDAAGNASGWTSDTIILDTTPPPAGTVEINGGAATVAGSNVTIGLSKPSDTTDITHVRLSNDGSTWTTFNYAATLPWTLTPGDGSRTVHAEWQDGAGHLSPEATDSITVDSTVGAPPAGTVRINAGARATRSTTVKVSISKPAIDVVKVRLASTAAGISSATWVSYSTPKLRTLGGSDGIKRVYVQWRDSQGFNSPIASDSILLDRVRPHAHAPHASFALNRIVGATVPTQISWSASDSLSGVRRYTLYRSVNGGTWKVIPLPTPTTRSIVLGLSRTASYRFAVKATDWAGNVSLRAVGPLLHVRLTQENSSAIHYTGTWRSTTSSSYLGTHDRYSTVKGSKAVYRLYGRAAAIVSAVGPTRGSMQIYVNGVLKQTISLYSPVTRTKRIVARLTWTSLNFRTITIRVVGTAGHPRVDLDAILVLR